MARSDIRIQTVLKQARQLSPQDQRRLATALLHSLRADEQVNLSRSAVSKKMFKRVFKS